MYRAYDEIKNLNYKDYNVKTQSKEHKTQWMTDLWCIIKVKIEIL